MLTLLFHTPPVDEQFLRATKFSTVLEQTYVTECFYRPQLVQRVKSGMVLWAVRLIKMVMAGVQGSMQTYQPVIAIV